jgi:hypothetical protein
MNQTPGLSVLAKARIDGAVIRLFGVPQKRRLMLKGD